MKKYLSGLCVASSLFITAPALAAPATVKVRVEGPTRTLIETTVATDTRTFRFTGGTTEYKCDSTESGPPGATPSPTRNVALMVAGEQTGTPVLGSFGEFGASFTSIGGESVAFDAGSGAFLAEFKNGVSSNFGGCGDPITSGDEVLYGYGAFDAAALKLTGPATVAPGAAVPVKVTDGGTAAPIAGAAVGTATTAADGTATVGPFTARGPQPALKATKSGAIRSNALVVCVTDGTDGFCGSGVPAPPATPCVHSGNDGRCGTPDQTPALGQIKGVREQQKFAKGKGPRTLTGTAGADVKDVRIRLTKSVGPRGFGYDAKAERFARLARYGANGGKYFSVGDKATWSYLLPAKLDKGRYVLDVRVTDKAGNVDGRLDRGRSRIVFFVR